MNIIGGADGPTSIYVRDPFMEDFFFGGGFNTVFTIVSVIVIGVIAAAIIRMIFHGVKNSASPILSVEALVVTKRTSVWGDHAHTSYYVTFEVESGDRLELQLAGEEYGLLAEGDRGKLTFQGTRYCSFERDC